MLTIELLHSPPTALYLSIVVRRKMINKAEIDSLKELKIIKRNCSIITAAIFFIYRIAFLET